MFYLQLAQNVALLVSLVVIHDQIIRVWNKNTYVYQLFSGFLFGCVALVGMMTPVHLMPGLIFDGRSIVLSVAGLFGGPVTAGIAAIMSAAYRLWMGGPGAVMGVSVILESAGLGVIFYYLRRHHPELTRNLYLFGFGLLVHVGMLLLTLTLPREAMLETLEHIAMPVLLIYPAATWLISLLFLDQEARMSAEEAVRESEARYRAVFENAAMGIDALDRDGRIAQVNPSLSNMLGYTEDELKGRTFEELTHPDDRQVSKQNLASLIKGEIDSYRLQKRYLRKDGEIVWSDVTTSSIKDANGNRTGVVAVIADTTERKRAETELRQSEEKFAKVFQYAPLLMTLNTLDEGMFLDVNDKFIEVSGFSRAESIGKTSAELGWFSAEDRMHLIEELQTHGSVRNKEIKLLTKDKREILCIYNGELIQTNDRQLLLSIAEDVTDLRKTEEALLQSDARRRLAQDAAKAGTWEWDLRTNENFWSEELWGLYGLEPHSCEPSYDAWRQTIHPDDRATAERVVQEAAFKGAELSAEWRIQDNEGAVRWLMSRGRPVSDATGQVVRYIGICIDITEQKLAAEALKRERDQAQNYLDVAGVMIVALNAEGNITTINQKGCDILGYGENEILGRNWFDVCLPAELRQELKGVFDQLMTGDIAPVEYFENPVLTGNGKQRIMAFHNTVLYDSPDRIVGILSSGEDITDRKRAEENLQKSENFLEQIVENIPDMIFVKEAKNLRFVRFNKAGEDLLGYSQEDLLGKNDYDFFPLEQADFFITKDKEVLASGKLLEIVEEEIDTRLKGKRIVHTKKIPVLDANGAPQFLLGISEDITERKLVEKEREHLKSQLLQAQKMEAVGTLAGGIAHDFNNLLQAISGYSELLMMNKKQGDPELDDLQRIYDSTKRGADLVKSLMMFSRRTKPEFRPVDLNQEIVEVQKILFKPIPKIIEMVLRLSGKLETVLADPSQIGQILMNLGVNARDAMPDGGTLTIKTANVQLDYDNSGIPPEVKPGPYVLLTVSDSGCGMDKQTVEHIFDPFFTTKEVGKGTGLGLATVYGIVKEHEGHITCDSEPGHGTTFKIYLPAIQTEKTSELPKDDIPIQGGTETILLVEDEESLRLMGSRHLNQYGYHVITASNGREALDIYPKEGKSISLIILDLVMPVMDGRKCLEKILGINPNAKVIIASGVIEEGSTNVAQVKGAKGSIRKPFDIKGLLRMVREVLDKD